MRVLVVSKMAPWPPDSGGRVRLWNLLKGIASRAEVMVVAFGDDPRAAAQARDTGFDLVLVPAPARPHGVRGLLRRIVGTLWGPPTEVVHWRSGMMDTALRDAALAFRPDIIQVEFYQMLPYALRLAADLPVTLTVHDIGWVPVQRAARLARGLRRWYLARQAWRTRRFEVHAYNKLRALWVMSDTDASLLRSAGVTRPSRVVPNGVAVNEIVAVSQIAGTQRVLFVGSAKHLPNVDALRWYLESVHPHVRTAAPGSLLDVVGMAEEQFVGPHSEGVVWHGIVPDVRPYYSQASAVIAPLRIGGGTRVKILEAMAYGVPVVSTSVGIEGIRADAGCHFLLADTPDAFAAAVSELLSGEGNHVAAHARELVERRYSWDAAVTAQLAGYSALISEGRRHG